MIAGLAAAQGAQLPYAVVMRSRLFEVSGLVYQNQEARIDLALAVVGT